MRARAGGSRWEGGGVEVFSGSAIPSAPLRPRAHRCRDREGSEVTRGVEGHLGTLPLSPRPSNLRSFCPAIHAFALHPTDSLGVLPDGIEPALSSGMSSK